MSDIAIRVEDLSKQYRIGAKQEGYRTLRDTLTGAFVSPFRRAQRLLRGQAYGAAELDETIWALKDVSFQIKRGEVVGIIGPNGAGKTTLLKILSRITEPTEGWAEIYGRIGSLLEVGTGFHPELTGRENIYLNGAILGMRKAEIERKFDEMVDFAEIEKFIDTPVKHYSSGMYVRLAFAVAAHLEPEILLVDEVLAVGDTAFQKKCLGKMGDVASAGRTVLFVSHNMGAVRQLCPHTLLLDGGRIVKEGETAKVLSYYLENSVKIENGLPGQIVWNSSASAPGNEELKLLMIRLVGSSGQPQEKFEVEKNIRVEVVYQAKKPLRGVRFILSVLTSEGVLAFSSTDQSKQPSELVPGTYCSTCEIPGQLLNVGKHYLSIHAGMPGVRVLIPGETYLSFTTDGVPQHGSNYSERWPGVVCPRLEWNVERLAEHEKKQLLSNQ